MGKTLRLNDDYWHGLIPFFVLSVVIPSMFLSLQLSWALIWLLVIVLVLSNLQFINEWKQSVDPYLQLKYGDLEGFRINSKRDTKFFVIGIFSGVFTGLILTGVIGNVFN